MYVQLKSVQHVVIKGAHKTLYPGDWCDVGRQQAQLWLASGEAWLPANKQLELMPADCAILIRSDDGLSKHAWLTQELTGVAIEGFNHQYESSLPHAHNLLWKDSAPLRLELMPVGFNLLRKWDVACPLYDYEIMAREIGSTKEREMTEQAIFDLRCPVYDTRLLFVRRNDAGQTLVKAWVDEMKRIKGDERLAFLRALFTVKPRIAALPTSWLRKG